MEVYNNAMQHAIESRFIMLDDGAFDISMNFR